MGLSLTTSTSMPSFRADRVAAVEPALPAWRALNLLVAIVVVPFLFDGLVVVALQFVPKDMHLWNSPIDRLAMVLPPVALGVSTVCTLVAPFACCGWLGRLLPWSFAPWPPASLFLLWPGALLQLFLAVLSWEIMTIHLWAYSATVFTAAHAVPDIENCSFWAVVSAALWVSRLVVLGLVARGIDRVSDPDGGRRSAWLVVVVVAVVWFASAFLPRSYPDAIRGVVDLAAGVSLLLLASLTRPAFDGSHGDDDSAGVS